MTKAGGPNPKRFFPRADNLVLFSKENADFFAVYPKFRGAHRHHIPNRAVEIQDDPRRIAKVRATLDPNRPTFLRIARFNPHYRESLVQAVNLVKRLNADGAPCQLVLIGTPQIPAVYGEILALRDEHIHIFAEDEYTVEASQLLGLADFVVSTGRSIMEASSKGKILLTPFAGGTIPVLVTPENFQSFFETNFSPRNSLAGYDEEANYTRLRGLVADRSQAEELKNQSREWFDRHFSIHGAIDAYRTVYETATSRYTGKPHLIDALLNFGQSARHFMAAQA
jgi:glycosyltransferase involved in cell wall biosynthesis